MKIFSNYSIYSLICVKILIFNLLVGPHQCKKKVVKYIFVHEKARKRAPGAIVYQIYIGLLQLAVISIYYRVKNFKEATKK